VLYGEKRHGRVGKDSTIQRVPLSTASVYLPASLIDCSPLRNVQQMSLEKELLLWCFRLATSTPLHCLTTDIVTLLCYTTTTLLYVVLQPTKLLCSTLKPPDCSAVFLRLAYRNYFYGFLTANSIALLAV
jgi:hypothetical protein